MFKHFASAHEAYSFIHIFREKGTKNTPHLGKHNLKESC